MAAKKRSRAKAAPAPPQPPPRSPRGRKVAFYLWFETITKLEQLSQKLQMPRSSVVSLALRQLHEHEGSSTRSPTVVT